MICQLCIIRRSHSAAMPAIKSRSGARAPGTPSGYQVLKRQKDKLEKKVKKLEKENEKLKKEKGQLEEDKVNLKEEKEAMENVLSFERRQLEVLVDAKVAERLL